MTGNSPIIMLSYEGELLSFLTARNLAKPIPFPKNPRLYPFGKSHERDTLPLVVDRWFIDLGYKYRRSSNTDAMFNLNNCLAVLDHFGFDANYDKKFIRYLLRDFTEIMLRSFLVDDKNPASRRFIYNRYWDFKDYVEQVDIFFFRYLATQ